MTRGGPGAAQSWEAGAGATGTRGASGVALTPGPWDTRARAPALSFVLTWSLYPE
jgi:hypothetical protein